MSEKAFVFLFVAVIIGMFMVSIENRSSAVGGSATSSSHGGTTNTNDRSGISRANPPSSSQGSSLRPSTEKEDLSNAEIKAELEDLYDEVWEVEQKVDAALRKRPASPYVGLVTLSRSGATTIDADREYLTITVNKNSNPITITGWSIESYVTEKRVTIPEGAVRYKAGGAVNNSDPIVLNPGQRAFLVTGRSPVRTAFQENMCIGYALKGKTLYPGVTNACPKAMDLMERYGEIDLDDDRCYAFVRTVKSCEIIDPDDDRLDTITDDCRDFALKYLSYDSCVEQFGNRTDFYFPNDWYVYFDRTAEQWRKQREILRLLDEHNRVVAVIEY